MTVKAENRWKQKLRREASQDERYRHERGALRNRAAGLYDKPRPEVVATPRVTARQVTAWMRRDLYDGDDVVDWVWDLAAAEVDD